MTTLLDPAPPWQPERSIYATLWHGCTTDDKNGIEAKGIDLAFSQVNLDFGRGFYTTTLKRQAKQWAWTRFYDPQYQQKSGIQPVLLRFRVPRDTLGKLVSLHFILGDYHNEDFWSLVQHCRQSVPAKQAKPGNPAVTNDHKGPKKGWYDIVTGPVAAKWQQRVAMNDADQVSFHTPSAIRVLNDLIESGKRGNRDDYHWEPVAP